jgi:GTP cyclohydrolase I
MEPVAVPRSATAAGNGAAARADREAAGGQAAAETVVPLRPTPRIDRARAEWAVSELLAAVGYPAGGEHRARTPERVVSALSELLVPAAFLPTTFPNDEGYDELVVARQVPFRSLCEHHLLPFYGHAHIGYLPGARIVGLSKLARVVEHFAAGLQVQERFTQQAADWLESQLGARGVGVVVEAEHLCMSLRGVRAMEARTVTSALRGVLRTDPRARDEFLALTRRSG